MLGSRSCFDQDLAWVKILPLLDLDPFKILIHARSWFTQDLAWIKILPFLWASLDSLGQEIRSDTIHIENWPVQVLLENFRDCKFDSTWLTLIRIFSFNNLSIEFQNWEKRFLNFSSENGINKSFYMWSLQKHLNYLLKVSMAWNFPPTYFIILHLCETCICEFSGIRNL